ncbi:MAG: O-antigen ligase family protein [Candidatus Humimicrobiaceae bacterium]
MTFPLILALIANKSTLIYKKGSLAKLQKIWFDEELAKPFLAFALIILMSTLIAMLRYANLWPFFTNNYYDLKVNIYGGRSTDAIYLVLKNFFSYLAGLGVFLVAINCFRKIKDIINALVIFVCSTAISAIFLLFQKFVNPAFGNFEPWISSGRLNATFADPNALGSYTVLLFPIFLIIIFYFKKWYLKFIFSIFLVLLVIMSFFSGSRSSLIGIFLALLILTIFGIAKLVKYLRIINKKKRIVIQTIIISLLDIIVLSSLAIGFTDNKVKSYFQNSGVTARAIESIKTAISFTKQAGFIEGIKSASNKRNFFWVRAYQMGRDYPLSGVGIGAFIIELPDYHWKYDKGFDQIDYAGNYYLQIFAELGIPGLVLILIIFIFIIKKFHLYSKLNKKFGNSDKNYLILIGLFISFITTTVIFLFGSHINNMEIHVTFWLITGLLISYIYVSNKEINNSSEENVVDLDKYDLAGYYKLNIMSRKGRQFNKRLIIASFLNTLGVIIIASIFTFNFAVSAFGPLSIYIKQDIFKWPAVWGANTFGFNLPEGYGEDSPRFTEADAGFCLEKKGSILTFSLKAQNPDIASNPLFVKIYMDYKLFTTVKLKDTVWHKYKLKIPQNGMDFFTITLINSRTFVPMEWGINDDTRELGVMFGDLGFTE